MVSNGTDNMVMPVAPMYGGYNENLKKYLNFFRFVFIKIKLIYVYENRLKLFSFFSLVVMAGVTALVAVTELME